VAVPAPDGSLSDLVYDAVKEQVNQEGAFSIRRLDVAAPDAARLTALAHKASEKFLGGFQMDALLPALEPYRARCGCEALLVVSPSIGVARANSGLLYEGLAWVAQGGFSGDEVSRSNAMASVRFFLVDASAGQAVAMAENAIDAGLYNAFDVPVTKELWPTAMDGLTTEQWEAMRQPMALVLRSTLRLPLFKLGLKPSCTMYFFELYKPRRGARNEESPPTPPAMPAGSDPSRCTAPLSPLPSAR